MKIKFITLRSIFFIICTIFLVSCSKEISTEISFVSQKTNDSFNKVLSWLKTKKEVSGDSTKASIDNIIKNLQQDKILAIGFNKTEKLLILPLNELFQTWNKSVQKTNKMLVLIESVDGKIRLGNIVELMPVNSLSFEESAEVLIAVYNNKISNFSGNCSILSLSNRPVYEIDYENGKITAQKYPAKRESSGGGVTTPSASLIGQCIEWYWQTYINGVLVSEVYLYTDCGINVEEGGNGGGGGSGSGGSSVTVDSVNNELTQICILNAFNAITSAKLKNQLAKLYQETFVGVGKVHNLLIGEVSSIPDPSNPNNQLVARSVPDYTNSSTWVIDINSGFEHEFTTELWGSVILHEMVHGFIKKNNLDFYPSSMFDGSHQQMLDKWITQIQGALVESFGMSTTDALALSLEGFDEILKDDVSGSFRNDMILWIQNKYSIDLATASQIADQYYNKTKGTVCP